MVSRGTPGVVVMRLLPTGRVSHTVVLRDDMNGIPRRTIEDGDWFGSSIASIGDVSGDGFNDLAVGAPLTDTVRQGDGAVYILRMAADDTVSSMTRISQAVGEGLTELSKWQVGRSLAAIPPRGGDGVVELVCGLGSANLVFLVRLSQNGTVVPNSTQTIGDGIGGMSSSEIQIHSRFGSHVAGAGDLNGDGVDDLVVSAESDGAVTFNDGAVYILFLSPGGSVNPVSSHIKLTKSSPGLSGEIPSVGRLFSGGVIADLNGDGRPELLLGIPRDPLQSNDTGSVAIAFMGGAMPSTSPTPSATPLHNPYSTGSVPLPSISPTPNAAPSPPPASAISVRPSGAVPLGATLPVGITAF